MLLDPARLRADLADRYTLGEEVGSGGMALVFRAHDRRHGREVALKLLRPDIAGYIGSARFLQEIQIESRLQHPHILPVLDSGEAAGLPYYVMPFVEGASLADRLARDGPLTVEEALRITSQVGSALAYAHSRGVVHRDVKPGNILLSNGQALVADFGIARAVIEAGGESLTSSGLVLGTPAYMSPEQGAFGEPVDGRSDEYSLACVLHQMLVGEPPFGGPSAQAILARHARERPPSISVVRDTVPGHVVAVIERALSKVPADRYPTVDAMLDALADPSWWRPATARNRRRWLLGAAAVAAGLVIWAVTRPAAVALDPNKVVVSPLIERGFSVADSGAGYDVALMITAALEHAEPLKGFDGSRTLPPTLGARYLLDGVVRRDQDSTVVILRLHDRVGDSLVAQESAGGASNGLRPYQLGLQALRPLLPRILDPGRTVDLAPIAERRVGAVALWIQGERRYRHGQFSEALALYQRAVVEDSGLVLAAVKGAQAASWENRFADAGALARLAIQREALLPRRYAEFARGVAAYVGGEADTALARFTRALAASPEWSEARMATGEVAYHLFPGRQLPDTFAEAAFAAALAGDPGFLPPAVHLAEIALRKGDVSRADRYLDALRSSAPDSMIVRQLGLMRSCVEGDLDRAGWRVAVLRDGVETVLRAAQILGAGAAQPACAEAAYRAILTGAAPALSHWGAFLGLHGVLGALGRRDDLVALVDSVAAAGTPVARALYILDLQAGLEVAREARAFAGFLTATYGDTLERLGRTASAARTRWMLGSWLSHQGEPGITQVLHGVVAHVADSLQSQSAALFGRALAAQLALARGDSAGALALLRAIGPVAPREALTWDLSAALPAERLQYAELALAADSAREALAVASRFDHPDPVIYLPFIPASLRLRIRAARALGRSDLVDLYRARLRRLDARDIP